MNLLDWVLIIVVVLYAVSGYWQGFITGAFATVGLLLGGLLGVWLAPTVLGDASPSILVSLAAVFIVIVCASLGQAVFQVGGARLRDKIKWQPVRALDAAGGAVLSGAAALLVAWALGVALSGSGLRTITPLGAGLQAPRRGQPRPSRGRELQAVGVQRRRRDDVLPALPRAVRAGADRPRATGSASPAHRSRRAAGGRGGRAGPRHQPLSPGHRGLRLRLRPRPGDDQRARGRRRTHAR